MGDVDRDFGGWDLYDRIARGNPAPQGYVLEESQRQVILLAVGRLAVERPGWDWMLGELAEALHGREMYERFKALKREELEPLPTPGPARVE